MPKRLSFIFFGISFLPPLHKYRHTFRKLRYKHYYINRNIVTNAVKDLQEQIDIDLPRFVYSMKQEMLVSHDVLIILERHKNDYSDHWRKQMRQTKNYSRYIVQGGYCQNKKYYVKKQFYKDNHFLFLIFLVLVNFPLLYFLNRDWFQVLVDTTQGTSAMG